jgi:hypothetical protein
MTTVAGHVPANALPTRPPETPAEKWERAAFTFCKLGTTGLIAWALTPPIFVLVVSIVGVGLYARSITLGVSWSKCLLRRPTLIIGFWAMVAAIDAAWLVWLR